MDQVTLHSSSVSYHVDFESKEYAVVFSTDENIGNTDVIIEALDSDLPVAGKLYDRIVDFVIDKIS